MQAVYEAANLIDAYLVRHALEDEGIPVFVRGEALVGGIGELPACGLLAVCVPEDCMEQALQVITGLPLLAGDSKPDANEADTGMVDNGDDATFPGCPQAG